MTQVTPRIAAEIILDGPANHEANLLIGSIRQFAHVVTTASVVASARRKFPGLPTVEAISKLRKLIGDEVAAINYVGRVLRERYERFSDECKPALASAVAARHDSNARAAQLKAMIENSSRRHNEKLKSLRSVLTESELAEIKGPDLVALKAELADTEAKIASLDEYISSSGLKQLPSFVVVSEPVRVSNNEAA